MLSASKSKVIIVFWGIDYHEPSMPIQEGRGLKDVFSGSLCYEL